MSDRVSVKTIFDQALEIADPLARLAYLDDACVGAPDIRERVDALLHAYNDAGSFLQPPPDPARSGSREDDTAAHADEAGHVLVGRYKLIQQIGEGGMGQVWMAEQQEPVKRLVALNVIKPGMDSAQVLARFEQERQAVALMDHPNIAKVVAAGPTASAA